MKVLIFHPIIAPYRIDLFNQFCQRFDAKVCLFKHNLSSQKFDYSKIEEQFVFSPIYIERCKGLFQWIRGIIRQIRTCNPDVVVCSEFGIATILAVVFKFLALKKYRVVSLVDDSYSMVAKGKQFSRKHAWASLLVTPFLDNVINVEPRVVDYYKKKFGKGVFMPIIVDDIKAREKYQKLLPISQNYVEKYQLVGKKVLLFVGRLVNLKNVSFAIKAFVAASVENAVFVVVGDGPERDELEKMSLGCKNVIFTGRLEGDALYAWYNVASVFTLPSVQEPFGAVTNEALLGGCFALISELAGSNCLIKENVNGCLIDPYNETQFVEILKESLDKAAPISQPLSLRPNGMLRGFNDCFEDMLKELHFDG